MTARLKIDTKETLFDPIEVEIDGKVIKVRTLTIRDLQKIQELEKEAVAGSVKAIKEMILSRLETDDPEVLDHLQMPQLKTLIDFVVTKAMGGGGGTEGEAKNASGPGVN
jgi:hypothetical protein